jgi:hypothetical protein
MEPSFELNPTCHNGHQERLLTRSPETRGSRWGVHKGLQNFVSLPEAIARQSGKALPGFLVKVKLGGGFLLQGHRQATEKSYWISF